MKSVRIRHVGRWPSGIGEFSWLKQLLCAECSAVFPVGVDCEPRGDAMNHGPRVVKAVRIASEDGEKPWIEFLKDFVGPFC